MQPRPRSLAAAVLATLISVPASAQSTWHVDGTGTPPGSGTPGDPYTSIQFAVDQPSTAAGDTILVAPGTYAENVLLNKDGLVLRSTAGALETTIHPVSAGAVVKVTGGAGGTVVVEGFTLTGGFGFQGAGAELALGGDGAIVRCILAGNTIGVNAVWDGSLSRSTITDNGTGITVSGVAQFFAGDSIVYGNGTEVSCSGLLPLCDFAWCVVPDLSSTICAATQSNTFYADPLLWDPAGLDVHLRPDSPCIDAGNPTQTDPDGSRLDIGALPFENTHSPASPTVYCTAKVNSQGCTPSIGFTGAPSASGAPFDVTCSQVLNNKSGLLFYGYGSKAIPFQGGWLCVRSPARRTALQSSGGNPPPDDCSGLYAFDFDARIQSGVDPALAAGQGVFIQYWFRDPLGTPPFTTGRSDAVAATIAP